MNKLVIAFGLASIALLSCKKGENDPFISTMSRTTRLAGNWELVEMEYYGTVGLSSGYARDYQFDGSNMKATWQETGQGDTTATYPYSLHLTINRQGTFKSIERDPYFTWEYHEKWSWLNGRKKKLYLELADWQLIPFNIIGIDYRRKVYEVDRLTEDELVLIWKARNTQYNAHGASTSKHYSGRWVFRKQ